MNSQEPSDAVSATAYPQALVGEQHYQEAIAGCVEGDEVTIWHEPDNPFDDLALAVARGGRTIGYIPKDSFLREAFHEERKGALAKILRLEDDQRGHGFTHVVIEVELFPKSAEKPIGVRNHYGAR